jgi:GNAT superfamily N-acetyltransferase
MAASLTGPMEGADPVVITEICRFRARVWKEIGKLAEGAFGSDGWRDPIDSHSQHWVIRTEDGTLVAAGRLSIHDTLDEVHESREYRQYGLDFPGKIAAPDRVVVCPSMQGRGLGWQILDAQDQAAVEHGARHAVRQASPGMVRLLSRRGWKIVGPASTDSRFPGEVFQVAFVSFDQRDAA